MQNIKRNQVYIILTCMYILCLCMGFTYNGLNALIYNIFTLIAIALIVLFTITGVCDTYHEPLEFFPDEYYDEILHPIIGCCFPKLLRKSNCKICTNILFTIVVLLTIIRKFTNYNPNNPLIIPYNLANTSLLPILIIVVATYHTHNTNSILCIIYGIWCNFASIIFNFNMLYTIILNSVAVVYFVLYIANLKYKRPGYLCQNNLFLTLMSAIEISLFILTLA